MFGLDPDAAEGLERVHCHCMRPWRPRETLRMWMQRRMIAPSVAVRTLDLVLTSCVDLVEACHIGPRSEEVRTMRLVVG